MRKGCEVRGVAFEGACDQKEFAVHGGEGGDGEGVGFVGHEPLLVV